jgi:concanavalin A-like lectin/glucanase superfamily protein
MWAVVLVVVAGCRFALPGDHAGDEAPGDAADAPGVPDGDTPSPDTPAAFCNAADLDLHACFTFDGDTLDRSSYGNTVSATGTSFVEGVSGQALGVTAGSNVAAGDSPSLDVTVLTIKMNIKPTTIPTGTLRAGLFDSSNRYRMFLQAGGAIRCALTGGVDLTSPTGVIVMGVWQRVTCTYDTTTMNIYVDGALVATMTQAGAIPVAANGFVIGQNSPSGENFDGAIDNVQLWESIVAP